MGCDRKFREGLTWKVMRFDGIRIRCKEGGKHTRREEYQGAFHGLRSVHVAGTHREKKTGVRSSDQALHSHGRPWREA